MQVNITPQPFSSSIYLTICQALSNKMLYLSSQGLDFSTAFLPLPLNVARRIVYIFKRLPALCTEFRATNCYVAEQQI